MDCLGALFSLCTAVALTGGGSDSEAEPKVLPANRRLSSFQATLGISDAQAPCQHQLACGTIGGGRQPELARCVATDSSAPLKSDASGELLQAEGVR